MHRQAQEAHRLADDLADFHMVALGYAGLGRRADVHVHDDAHRIGNKAARGQALGLGLAAVRRVYAPAECCFQLRSHLLFNGSFCLACWVNRDVYASGASTGEAAASTSSSASTRLGRHRMCAPSMRVLQFSCVTSPCCTHSWLWQVEDSI